MKFKCLVDVGKVLVFFIDFYIRIFQKCSVVRDYLIIRFIYLNVSFVCASYIPIQIKLTNKWNILGSFIC